MLSSGIFSGNTSLKPDCIVGINTRNGCTPGMGACLIAYPPDQPWGGYRINITLYQPCETGEGTTGIQMGIVFDSSIQSGETTFMSQEEGDTEIYAEYVTPLGLTSITVIANTYQIQTSAEFPNGFVVVDVEVS